MLNIMLIGSLVVLMILGYALMRGMDDVLDAMQRKVKTVKRYGRRQLRHVQHIHRKHMEMYEKMRYIMQYIQHTAGHRN